MKILLIDDDPDKRERIASVIEEEFPGAILECAESLRSGLGSVVAGHSPNIMLLDMSMPSFDIGVEEPEGGMPESFAGRDLMEQMRLRKIAIPTVVITQYRMFDSGSVSLEDLNAEFGEKFSEFYLGAIYYNSAMEGWKRELSEYLRQVAV